jgi:Methyltransferase domain
LNPHVSDVHEVNRGYVPSAPDVPADPVSAEVQAFIARLNSRRSGVIRLVLLPALFLVAIVLLIMLEVQLRVRRGAPSWLHQAAADRVTAFVEQYPLHLYPILAKAFEAAYLDRFIPELLADSPRVLEIAIGDGTLSQRVFPADAQVVGLDIEPYVLRHAVSKPHVRRAVVCDCLSPPVAAGTFEVLVANNFLHHVTAKGATLGAWAPMARIALFNESTPFWASSWVRPRILERLGLRRKARVAAAAMELMHLQSLQTLDELDHAVSAAWNIRDRQTYLSASTFFRCAIFSTLMRCTGPPTPQLLKRLLLGPLRWPSVALTRALAHRLVALDATEDRATDAYVSYVAESRSWRANGGFICPGCGAYLDGSDCCSGCGHQYETIDGMLFLLPRKLDHIRLDYSQVIAATVPAERL